ncbi:hypothetical protein [Aquimarina pacifica]|uniref:hypothetical protein n=1 Tax=Aquimarina pacifica TaxID=1296415 RepID=UPI00046F8BBE|nr:hypothetical protein [Aquimarina pacifica]
MDKKEQWADDILHSLEGAKRAIPKNDLFDEILAKIPEKKENKIIPLVHLTWIAAAAVAIIVVNVYALQLQNTTIKNVTESSDKEVSLLSNYVF